MPPTAPSERTPEEDEHLARLFRARRAAKAADARLSLPTPTRLLLATSSSFLLGMALGVSHGSSAAGLRFRAENAHRLPATPTGWYLYHKTKNYNMALGGVREGLKMGARMSVWVAAFFAIEDAWDEIRGKKDFVNTVIASLTVAGGFSLWSKSWSFFQLYVLSSRDGVYFLF